MSKATKSKATKSKAKSAKANLGLLSQKTVSLIEKGIASRDKIIVLACLDVVKTLPTAGRDAVRAEIKAIDPGFAINNDSLQSVLNAIRKDRITVQKRLLEICTDARVKGNEAKAKSKAKTGKAKTSKDAGKAKAKAKSGTGKAGKDAGKGKHQDSILELPLPRDYDNLEELMKDYNYLSNWLAVAEALLRKEKLIK